MPVEPWPTVVVGGKEYWEVDGKFRVAKESDPNAQVLILIGTPNGGIANVGPLVKGDPGQHAEIDETIDFTALEPEDPTPDSMSWTTITPPDDDTPGVYRLVAALHKGAKGDDGDTVLDPNDFDTPLAGQILVVNDAVDAFVLQNQKIATRHLPTAFTSVADSSGKATVATVSIPAKTHDYRVIVAAQVIVTGSSGPNVSVDLLCRMGDAVTGNVVARCFGVGGAQDRLTIVSSSPANSNDAFDKVTAGNAKDFYLRTERASGSDSYNASDSTMLYEVWAIPV
ncbi:hypothetical protein ACX9NE_26740 [Mycobacterium sp. ML4]